MLCCILRNSFTTKEHHHGPRPRSKDFPQAVEAKAKQAEQGREGVLTGRCALRSQHIRAHDGRSNNP